MQARMAAMSEGGPEEETVPVIVSDGILAVSDGSGEQM